MIYLILGMVLIVSVFSSKLMYKLGVPTLIAFLSIGMILGTDGIGGIDFENFKLAEEISTIALVFIIFYGGMGTNVEIARPVVKTSLVFSTLGVLMTASIVGIFMHFVFKFTWIEGMLFGSIISSTDAASVFSILRSKKLNLKNNLASMLELESGSNDPVAYMLTAIFTGFLIGDVNNIGTMLILQIGVGIGLGIILGKIGIRMINKFELDIEGLYSILIIGLILVTYSLTTILKGNGLLSVYIVGIIVGNSKILFKNTLVKYFDGISWLMQIFLFLTLGLLVFPTSLIGVAREGILVGIFIIFIARPIVIFIIMSFTKRGLKEKLLVSWVGFRGAASIVFAITPMAMGIEIGEKIFNIVFFISILSLLLQGTLLVPIAYKLGLVDENDKTKLKTFTDYTEEIEAEVLELEVFNGSIIVGKKIMDLDLPENILIMGIKRDNKIIVPRGNTDIEENDIFIIGGKKEILLSISNKYKIKLKDNI